tara:strand:+ start:1726 stop:2250 length:525 start_codon:yes stop_codon:yes gene_type:complete
MQLAFIKVSIYDDMKRIAELCGLDVEDPDVHRTIRYNGKLLLIDDIEQEVLEAAFAEYKADLETHLLQEARKSRSESIGELASGFINTRYTLFRQQFFQALFTEAIALGLANRIAYIRGLLNWCKSVVEYTATLDDELESIVSAVDIEHFEPDFSPFEESDPQVTIKGALAIED